MGCDYYVSEDDSDTWDLQLRCYACGGPVRPGEALWLRHKKCLQDSGYPLSVELVRMSER